jgi:acyl carrier protein
MFSLKTIQFIFIYQLIILSVYDILFLPSGISIERKILMDNNELQKRVKKAISKVLKVNEENIADDANFIFDLGADSLQSVELVAAFEEEFQIEMEEDKALEVQTVSDAVKFISQYLK